MGCDRPRTAATHFKQPNTKAENTPLRHLNTPPSFPPKQQSNNADHPSPPSLQRKGDAGERSRPQGDARGRTQPPLPLSSPTKGARASEASTRGMPGADGRCGAQSPFAPSVRGTRTSGARTQGDARGGEGPPPQIPTSPEPTPPSHPTPQSQTSFPILHILVQPNHRHTRQSNHAKHRVR